MSAAARSRPFGRVGQRRIDGHAAQSDAAKGADRVRFGHEQGRRKNRQAAEDIRHDVAGLKAKRRQRRKRGDGAEISPPARHPGDEGANRDEEHPSYDQRLEGGDEPQAAHRGEEIDGNGVEGGTRGKQGQGEAEVGRARAMRSDLPPVQRTTGNPGLSGVRPRLGEGLDDVAAPAPVGRRVEEYEGSSPDDSRREQQRRAEQDQQAVSGQPALPCARPLGNKKRPRHGCRGRFLSLRRRAG